MHSPYIYCVITLLILCIQFLVPREGGLYIILKGRVQETLKDSNTGEYTTNIVSHKNVSISKIMYTCIII